MDSILEQEFGLRQANKDTFSGGSDVDLNTLGWVKFAGTGSIHSNGSGTAYSTSAGANPSDLAYYSLGVNGNNANRLITGTCKTNSVGNLAEAGFVIRGTGAKAFTAVTQIFNAVDNNDYFTYKRNYGTPVAVPLGNLSGGPAVRSYRIVVRGSDFFIDIDNGALTYSDSFVGGATTNPSGLWYDGPALAFGAQMAWWTNFSVRSYPRY
jgi:hypothetical protein